MNTEWVELKGILDVAAAKTAGMEIEVYDTDVEGWVPWQGIHWFSDWSFRALTSKPKTVKVKSLCWRNTDGNLLWLEEGKRPTIVFLQCQRFPAGDIEGEVEA